MKVDQCVRCSKCVSFRYIPGDPILPVVALEQRKLWRVGDVPVHLVEGLCVDWYYKFRRETIITYTEGLYLVT